MRKSHVTVLAACLVLVLVAGNGCVGKKRYTNDIEQQDARMSSIESAVEANEKRVADLGKETDRKLSEVERKSAEMNQRAMSSAESAAKTAEEAKRGRLLWTVKLTDDKVKFGLDQTDVPAEAARELDSLVAKIKSYNQAVYLEIEGHTDSTGSEAYNMKLGEKRAMAVRNYLSEKGGIPLHAMNTISYGESRPEADNSTREGRAKNRRVVVRVLE